MKALSIIIILILFWQIGFAQTKKIVFVCEHGAAKSVIAAAYFNKMAKENNVPWEAICRGRNPDKEISQKTQELLKKNNLFNPELTPAKLTQRDVDQAQQVIFFCPLPDDLIFNNTLSWLGIDAVDGDFNKLRDTIVLKLNPLIDSLSRK
jgi:arsenate reductase